MRALFSQGSMNVYRRFTAEQRPKMVEFYEKALALRPLQPINLRWGPDDSLRHRHRPDQARDGSEEGRQYRAGLNAGYRHPRHHAVYPDEAGVTSRLQAFGYPAPAFKDTGSGTRAALVKDPGGF